MSYYGLDWVAMGTSLLAVYLLGQKNRLGFASFLVSNAIWVVVGMLATSWGIVAGNVIFFGLNVRGWLKWTAASQATSEKEEPLRVVAGGCP